MKVSKCNLQTQICGANNKLCPPGWNTYYQFIRPCYCKTSYFNQLRPDPYTYLQYWRRRMCYMNYLQYYGVLHSNQTQYPKTGKAMYENFTLMNEQGQGTYKINRKEPLRSDYVLFLEYQ